VDTGAAGPRRGLSATVRTALDEQREAAAALLTRAGWRVAVARADRSVSDVWQSLGGPGSAGAQAFAAAGRPVAGAPA
jgi:uncharacterized protein (DUF58 family)